MEKETFSLNEVASEIQHHAAASAIRKQRIDFSLRLFFRILTYLSASIVLIVLGFILVKGLKPFFVTYTETLSDGTVQSGTESWSYFFGGTLFDGGYDEAKHRYLYGVMYLAANTLLMMVLVAILAIPTSILTSLFITRIAPKPLAKIIETGVDLLASIPSVIFGVFGMGVIIPIVKATARSMGMLDNSGVSMLSGALLLSLMIMPTIISVSDTDLKAVNEDQIKGSIALGASKTQTNFKIALRSARSGILAGVTLGIGRAIGEATAVSMVTGLISGVTLNPFLPASVLTSQMLASIGEAVVGSLNYDMRFSIGIVLMVLLLVFDLILTDVKNWLGSLKQNLLFIVKLGRWIYRGIRRFVTWVVKKVKHA